MEFSRATYTGSVNSDLKFEDPNGTYEYPDGSKFVGALKDGAFHGEGKLYFGGGVFVGVWEKGKTVSGEYKFSDDLAYKESDWSYCDGSTDRRFASEIQEGKLNRASGGVYRNVPLKRPIKDGCYDAGDGYLKLKDGKIYSFDNDKVLRVPGEEELRFLMEKASTTQNTAKGKPVDEESSDEGGDFDDY